MIQKEEDSWRKMEWYLHLLAPKNKRWKSIREKGFQCVSRHSPYLSMGVTLRSINRWQNWHHEYWLETAHMAPGPVLLWSRSQSKLELGTNPFLCPAAVSGEVCNQDNSITAIYRHIPTWNLHSRKLTFPALTNSANTHMSISNIRVPQFCHRHCDEYTIIRIGVCQTHVRSTK